MTHGQTAVIPVALTSWITFKGRQFCESLATVSEKKSDIYFNKRQKYVNSVIMYILKHNGWSNIITLKYEGFVPAVNPAAPHVQNLNRK